MGLNQQVAEMAAQSLMQAWGGRMPTWDEYKYAVKQGRVRVNKTVAAEAISIQGFAPKSFVIIYGFLVPWTAFLAVPISIALVFILGLSWWSVLGAFALAIFLMKVTREGHCEGIKAGASENEDVYLKLVSHGAFLFFPV